MTQSSDAYRRDAVPARPCTGKLTPAGQPRHPRPAGVQLQLDPLCAADFGVRTAEGRFAPMDLGPLLDALAARYDGCGPCQDRHVTAIAADPPLVAHTVGVALCVLSSGPGAPTTQDVLRKLDPAGAAVALTLRTAGVLGSVQTARRLTEQQRRSAVEIALAQLLPTGWYHQPLSNFYSPETDTRTLASRATDTEMLNDLYADGYPAG